MRFLIAFLFSVFASAASACNFFETLPRFTDPDMLPPNYVADITDCIARLDDLQIRNDFGTTPLGAAVGVEEPIAVAALLAAGADVEDGGTRYRPLHSAAISRHTQDIGRTNEIIRLLIEAGADVRADRDAALDSARSNDNPEGVMMLLEAGADPLTVNEIGQSPFYASLNGDADQADIIAAMLRFGGIDPNAPVGPRNGLPLHLALSDNKAGTIKALLDAGANPNLQDELGRHPLQSVSFGKSGAAAVTKLLLDAGADPLILDSSGRPLIVGLTQFDGPDVFMALKLAGFDFATISDDAAMQILMAAGFTRDTKTFELLAGAGMPVPMDHPQFESLVEILDEKQRAAITDLIAAQTNR